MVNIDERTYEKKPYKANRDNWKTEIKDRERVLHPTPEHNINKIMKDEDIDPNYYKGQAESLVSHLGQNSEEKVKGGTDTGYVLEKLNNLEAIRYYIARRQAGWGNSKGIKKNIKHNLNRSGHYIWDAFDPKAKMYSIKKLRQGLTDSGIDLTVMAEKETDPAEKKALLGLSDAAYKDYGKLAKAERVLKEMSPTGQKEAQAVMFSKLDYTDAVERVDQFMEGQTGKNMKADAFAMSSLLAYLYHDKTKQQTLEDIMKLRRKKLGIKQPVNRPKTMSRATFSNSIGQGWWKQPARHAMASRLGHARRTK